ncbi:MAG: primosomal protein N' [Candidatus Yanofskybacteria bacterium RIFCSPHIGHO2_02_FULL_38_22b]|uniref:Probable replication restart protein PriA n=1 Tax=Candidatus Yanofskybacteria bacterium RIFCSPHIGHO2_02_FULL_38_22b TaxID=1802673 RepID=A0A1F8F2E9_9BACT|nr:MAG: primosomal protein N' [Candidatus Yanofskybacteria bacterium RIFCSPHIGHO2_02_FULL_38_22b]OGN20368.1 MAG: primosomal protein N' [Candidatus Yanofskybacteria bacterium RIFCSPLOWO2_01_FULL_39_28]
MYILEVIPIANLPPQVPQLLSYFFSKELPKGAIVEVVIGNRKVLAVVISSEPAENQKILLKKSSFQLKKISSIVSETPLVSETQFKIALWLSQNYFSPLGMCLKTVLPPFFLKQNLEPRMLNLEKSKFHLSGQEIQNSKLLLSRAKNIIKNITSEIKKTLRDKKQILLVVPEISIAKYFYNHLSQHHETVIIHSKINQKQYRQSWDKINSGDAEIIIGTRQALFAPFTNLGLIIVEDPSNEAYKSDMSPKYNTVSLVKKIAKIYSAKLLFVSQAPDVDQYLLSKNESLKLENKIRDLRSEIKIENMLSDISSGNSSIFSRELKNSIDKYLKEKKKVLIFSTRKGYSTSLICENCRFIFKCPQCSVPLRLHVSPADSLICYRCSLIQKIPDHCPNCNSYKLKSAGFAGSEKIKDELNFMFPNTEVVTFDSYVIKNIKQEEEFEARMRDLESFVCIGTQSIFGQRFNLNFDLVGIPNLDSLVTVPDFKAEETLFLQIEKLLDFKPQKIIIQTLHTKNQILETIISGNYEKLYENELKVRKLFWYPPFAKLIKLSFASPDRNKSEYEARILSEKLKMAILQMKFENSVKLMDPSPAFIEKQRGFYVYNIILKIMSDFKISDILKFIPSNWMIDVEPKSIL